MKAALYEHGIELAIAAGVPQADAAMRKDSSPKGSLDFPIEQRHISFGKRQVFLRSLRGSLSEYDPDFVIVEQAIKNLEIYPLLFRHLFKIGPRLAMWGHGRSYSTQQSSLEANWKQYITRRSDWFFSYTHEGAKYLVSRGFEPSRITVLRNTIDTRELRSQLKSITELDLANFRGEQCIEKGKTGLFIGGVDSHKGIDFLLASAIQMEKIMPGFVLLVGGDGSLANDVKLLQDKGGPVRYLGRLDGQEKALALRSADILMVPQWVGLVAVDSIISGIPIVTTNHPSHSPEFEYLKPNESTFVTNPEVDSYARESVTLLGDSQKLRGARARLEVDSEGLGITDMGDRFVAGILEWTKHDRK